jgi:hypothetical protein
MVILSAGHTPTTPTSTCRTVRAEPYGASSAGSMARPPGLPS